MSNLELLTAAIKKDENEYKMFFRNLFYDYLHRKNELEMFDKTIINKKCMTMHFLNSILHFWLKNKTKRNIKKNKDNKIQNVEIYVNGNRWYGANVRPFWINIKIYP